MTQATHEDILRYWTGVKFGAGRHAKLIAKTFQPGESPGYATPITHGMLVVTNMRVIASQSRNAGGHAAVSCDVPLCDITSVATRKTGMASAVLSLGAAGSTLDIQTLSTGLDGDTRTVIREAQAKFCSGQSGPTSDQAPPASIADELIKLAALRDAGVLTDAEFADQKSKMLG